MFPFFLKKTRFEALFAGLVLVFLAGLTISTTLLFTGCPPADPETQPGITINLVDPDALSVDITPNHVRDASQVTFTVTGNYHDYQWYLDGDKLNETSASLTLYKSVVGTDPRHIIVTALDAGGTPYSGAVFFQFD